MSTTSPLLPSPISITLWGTSEPKTFERVSDVIEWATLQKEAWADVNMSDHNLGRQWNSQRSHAGVVESVAQQLNTLLEEPSEKRTDQHNQQVQQLDAQLRQRLDAYVKRQVVSAAHPYFSHIQAVAETDPDAGATLLVACSANGQQFLAQHQHFDAIARIGITTAYLDKARRKNIAVLKREISSLTKQFENDISELRGTLDEQKSLSEERKTEHNRSVEDRTTAWTELTERCNTEWEELKRVYDEKLALLAPTEYWSTRSTSHKDKARNYAIAFGVALIALVVVFVYYGVDHLGDPGTGSVVIAVLPVLIPAFAGVWVLRILGRLLSENLKIAQDAQERETLVKTFLALMRDDTTGKSVVTDEDRTLILHALFRQSTVTAVDDAPPLSWIEMLRRKP